MPHTPRTLWLARAGLLAVATTGGLVAACSRCGQAEQRREAAPLEDGEVTAGTTGTDTRRGATVDVGSSSSAEAELEGIDVPDPPGTRVRRSDASGPDANREIFSDYGFPGYPGLSHLGGRRDLLPGGRRLMWDAFTSEKPPAAVVTHYKRWLSERGFAEAKPGGAWRLPPGSPEPERILEITTPSAPGRHRSCDKKPTDDAKSVIVLVRQ